MIRFFADVIPYEPERYRRVVPDVVSDSIDTVRTVVQEVSDGVSSGGGHHSLPYILGAILAGLVALGFLILMVRSYRRRGDQSVQFG